MKAVGQDVPFAPLSEVADICFDGILTDTFWIAVPNDAQAAKLRARVESQIEQAAPEYLLELNMMTSRPVDKEP